MADHFSDVWTPADGGREPFAWRAFLSLLWENTSGYLLTASLVSVLVAVLSWVLVVRAGPPPSPPVERTSRRPSSVQPADTTRPESCGLPPPPPAAPDELAQEQEQEPPDLVEMAHHLPGRAKRAELELIRRQLQQDMTDEQRRHEKQVELDQMAAIMELMQKNSDKFGSPSLDDVQSQLKLYM